MSQHMPIRKHTTGSGQIGIEHDRTLKSTVGSCFGLGFVEAADWSMGDFRHGAWWIWGQLRIGGQHHLPRLRLGRRPWGFSWCHDLGGVIHQCEDHHQIRSGYVWVGHMIAERWPKWLLITSISLKCLPSMSHSFGQICSVVFGNVWGLGGANLKHWANTYLPTAKHWPICLSASDFLLPKGK